MVSHAHSGVAPLAGTIWAMFFNKMLSGFNLQVSGTLNQSMFHGEPAQLCDAGFSKIKGLSHSIVVKKFLFSFKRFLSKVTMLLATLATVLALSACSPGLNWREVRGSDAPYTVLLPAKPGSHARSVNLGGLQVSMQMTAAEVGDLSFAVARASLTDAQQRMAAMEFMQQAMVQNIRGSITEQKSVVLKDGTAMNEIHAIGITMNGKRMALFARFGIKDDRVYQVVALGPQADLSSEIAETFLSSFVLH